MLRAVTGLDVQRELPNYDGLAGLAKVIGQHRGTVRAPVPMSLSPQPGETPNKVLLDGQWVPPADPELDARVANTSAPNGKRETKRGRSGCAASNGDPRSQACGRGTATKTSSAAKPKDNRQGRR